MNSGCSSNLKSPFAVNPYIVWDIGKQNCSRCDATNAVSHLGPFCLHSSISSKNERKMKKILLTLKRKWTHLNGKDGKVNSSQVR